MADLIAVTAAAIFVGIAIAIALAVLCYLWTVRGQEDVRRSERKLDAARFDELRAAYAVIDSSDELVSAKLSVINEQLAYIIAELLARNPPEV